MNIKGIDDTVRIPALLTTHSSSLSVLVDVDFMDHLHSHMDLFLSPFLSSVVALGVKISPGISKEEYETVVAEAFAKEIEAALSIYRPATFDYRSIFGELQTELYLPFSDRLPPNPDVASSIRMDFNTAKQLIHGMVIYPDLGKKSVGDLCAESFWSIYSEFQCTFKHENEEVTSELYTPWVSPRDIERLYEKTGQWVEGCPEVRCAWKYTDLKPRVYYARGGRVLQSSRYIQPIVNVLIDCFPEVHRINRFNPPIDSRLEPTDIYTIYDYASFTSYIDEVVQFVDHMAHFFEETFVTIIDSRDGHIHQSVGALLREYNRECNVESEFDIRRFAPHVDPQDCLLRHTCGMLGVQGNIFIATLLHGIHLRFVAGRNRSKCVGDDARFKWSIPASLPTPEDLSYLHYLLTSIGKIAQEKMSVFDGETDPILQAFRFVKRPIHRDEDLMIESSSVLLPSITDLCGFDDTLHTVRPKQNVCLLTYRQICRFLDTLVIESVEFSLEKDELDIKILERHIGFLMAKIRQLDPSGKFGLRRSSGSPYPLPPSHLWGKINTIEWRTNDFLFDETVNVPKMWFADEEVSYDVGTFFDGRMNAARSYLRGMGYVVSEKLHEDVSRALVGEEMFGVFMAFRYVPSYRFHIVSPPPTFVTL